MAASACRSRADRGGEIRPVEERLVDHVLDPQRERVGKLLLGDRLDLEGERRRQAAGDEQVRLGDRDAGDRRLEIEAGLGEILPCQQQRGHGGEADLEPLLDHRDHRLGEFEVPLRGGVQRDGRVEVEVAHLHRVHGFLQGPVEGEVRRPQGRAGAIVVGLAATEVEQQVVERDLRNERDLLDEERLAGRRVDLAGVVEVRLEADRRKPRALHDAVLGGRLTGLFPRAAGLRTVGERNVDEPQQRLTPAADLDAHGHRLASRDRADARAETVAGVLARRPRTRA